MITRSTRFSCTALLLCLLSARQGAAQDFAYVPIQGDNTVSVVNLATNTVSATIPVGSYPYAAAQLPNGLATYVVNSFESTVSVIDNLTNTVVETISGLSYLPRSLYPNPSGTEVWVCDPYSNTVQIINTATNTINDFVNIPAYPIDVRFSPDGLKAYVVESDNGDVYVINTLTRAIENAIYAGTPGTGTIQNSIAINPNGSRLYVPLYTLNRVAVYNLATESLEAIVLVGANPASLVVSPDGSTLYVGNNTDGTISVVSTATNTVTATILNAPYVFGLAFSPDGSTLYAGTVIDDQLRMINPATNTVTGSITVGAGPTLLGRPVQTNLIALPVKLTAFEARPTGTAAVCTWQVAGEQSLRSYHIQRSADGHDFATIGTVAAVGQKDYRFADLDPTTTTVTTLYYRLQMEDADGKTTYSSVQACQWAASTSAPAYTLSPNPAQAQDALAIAGPAFAGAAIVDATGQVQARVSAGTKQVSLAGLVPGIYFCRILGQDGVETSQRFVVQ